MLRLLARAEGRRGGWRDGSAHTVEVLAADTRWSSMAKGRKKKSWLKPNDRSAADVWREWAAHARGVGPGAGWPWRCCTGPISRNEPQRSHLKAISAAADRDDWATGEPPTKRAACHQGGEA